VTVARNRTELLERLGAKQRNIVWSWCAVNEAERKVYFSVWRDLVRKGEAGQLVYVVQEPHWGIDVKTGARSPARKEHDELLALALENHYEAFAYFIDAKDPSATPREIESTMTSFIRGLRLERQPNGTILGYPGLRIEIR